MYQGWGTAQCQNKAIGQFPLGHFIGFCLPYFIYFNNTNQPLSLVSTCIYVIGKRIIVCFGHCLTPVAAEPDRL